MTLAVSVIGKNSLVLGIDSRTVHTQADGDNIKFLLHDDNSRKMFLLKNNCALAFTGFGGASQLTNNNNEVLYNYYDIKHLAYTQLYNKNIHKNTFQDIDNYIVESPILIPDGEYLYVIIAGMDNEKLTIKIRTLPTKESSVFSDNGAFSCCGIYTDIAISYMKEYFMQKEMDDVEFSKYLASLNLKEKQLITLVKYTLKQTILYSKSKADKIDQGIGGNIDILVINKHKARWIQKQGKHYSTLSSLFPFKII